VPEPATLGLLVLGLQRHRCAGAGTRHARLAGARAARWCRSRIRDAQTPELTDAFGRHENVTRLNPAVPKDRWAGIGGRRGPKVPSDRPLRAL
jgi:hypothetical protein